MKFIQLLFTIQLIKYKYISPILKIEKKYATKQPKSVSAKFRLLFWFK